MTNMIGDPKAGAESILKTDLVHQLERLRIDGAIISIQCGQPGVGDIWCVQLGLDSRTVCAEHQGLGPAIRQAALKFAEMD